MPTTTPIRKLHRCQITVAEHEDDMLAAQLIGLENISCAAATQAAAQLIAIVAATEKVPLVDIAMKTTTIARTLLTQLENERKDKSDQVGEN